MSQWQFAKDDQARWRWRRLDEGAGSMESSVSFPTEIDCIMDAVRHAVEHRRSLFVTVREDVPQ